MIKYNVNYETDLTYRYFFVVLSASFIRDDRQTVLPDESRYLPQIIKDNKNIVTDQISCTLVDIIPRSIKVYLEGQLTFKFDNPFRPGTNNYSTLLQQVKQLPGYLSFETKGETIKPYKVKQILLLV